VAYTPGTTNSYSRYKVKMWHDLVAVRVLQRFNVLSSPPPVFRNWIFLGDSTGALRRGVLMHRLMTVNRDCMGSDTRVLYEGLLYYLLISTCKASRPAWCSRTGRSQR